MRMKKMNLAYTGDKVSIITTIKNGNFVTVHHIDQPILEAIEEHVQDYDELDESNKE